MTYNGPYIFLTRFLPETSLEYEAVVFDDETGVFDIKKKKGWTNRRLELAEWLPAWDRHLST